VDNATRRYLSFDLPSSVEVSKGVSLTKARACPARCSNPFTE